MKRGQSLVELLVAIGLTAILLPALITGLINSREGKPQMAQRVKAVAMMRETQEAVRSIRNRDWSNIADNGTYHTLLSGNMWASASGSITESGFTRSYTVSSVNRDSSGALVAPPAGSVDPSTKKIDILISWTQPYTSSITSTFYLTRWRDNLPYTETTEADFNAGTHTGTTVRETNPPQVTDDGEVILGSGGHSNWCAPNLTNSLNLSNQSGKATALTAIVGEAYAGTGESSSGEAFSDILVSNTDPPVPSIYGTFDGYKVNDIFGEADYAYVATDNNHEEVIVIQVSSLPFTKIGVFNAPGNDKGESVFVLNNTGYLIIKDKLYNFDLTNKSSPTILDTNGVTLSKEGTSVFVVGNYAYVSITGNNDVQLDIINVSNPTNIVKVGSADVNNQSGKDVFVSSDGNRAYVVTNATSSTEKEFHIVNTTNKSSPVKIGSGYHTSGMNPEAIEVVPGNRAIVVGQGAKEYQVVRLDNESSPTMCAELDVDVGIFDSTSVVEPDGDVYAYIGTADANGEFKIIAGGPGGSYASEGIFESQTFDPGYQTADNRFEANFNQPAGTTIQFQVSLANQVSGACPSSYTFVGQDGTSSTWFPLTPTPGISTLIATFPFGTYSPNYANPGQCFRYKVKMSTTDQNSTPVLNDFTINYSP